MRDSPVLQDRKTLQSLLELALTRIFSSACLLRNAKTITMMIPTSLASIHLRALDGATVFSKFVYPLEIK